jgi:hypothetical protein
MDLTFAYAADITKSERDAEGNLIVYGSATNPTSDLDGDRCDPAWLKRAMPEWFEWGNIREMHGPIAAGVGLEMTVDSDDYHVKSKCVDPVAAKKIVEGVYKGYSIGIKNGIREKRDGQNWITGGTIVEVSYVDRPCNPTAKLAFAKAATVGDDLDVLQPVEADPAPVAPKVALPNEFEFIVKDANGEWYKRTFTAQQRHDLAQSGAALPDGSYPIENGEDLENAIHAVGRGTKHSHDEIRQHIVARAKALGLTDRLPAGYLPKKKDAEPEIVKAAPQPDNTVAVADAVKAAVAEVMAASSERIEALEAQLTKVLATPVPGGPVLMSPDGPTMDKSPGAEKKAKADTLRKYAQKLDAKIAEDYYALADRVERGES